MEIISLLDCDRRDFWLEKINNSGWGAGRMLARLICEGTFAEAVGADSKVLLLTDGEKLVSYCTYAEKDDIQPTDLTPWVGFVYTCPEYRGHRYFGCLLEEIEQLAREDGVREIYISTNHTGLYEKYGCEFKAEMNDMDGSPSRVYVKKIS